MTQGSHGMFAAKAGVATVFLGAAWTVIASLAFLTGTHLANQFAHPFYQWWIYFLLARSNPIVATWLEISAGLATAVVAVFSIGLVVARSRKIGPSLRPRFLGGQATPIRGATDNHGHAAWKDMREVRKLFRGPTKDYGGLVVGEAYRVDQDRVASIPFDPQNQRTWGQGGRAPLLIDPCRSGPTHTIVFAGSGAFKSQCAVMNLLYWTGSVVVLDPAGELGNMTAAERRRMGHTVHLLSLRGDVGFNVLDWINMKDPEATTNIKSVARWICGDGPVDSRDGSDDFFKSRGRALVSVLLAHMLADPDMPADLKTVATMRTAISKAASETRKILRSIHATSPSRYARDQAGPLMDLVDETFSGVHSSADDMTEWLTNEAAASMVSRSTFKSTDLLNGRTTVFLNLSLNALQTMPGLARTVIGALTNSAYEANGTGRGRILFLLDEVARLGRMGILETARDAGRKFGITLQLLYQSVGQIEQQWGRDGKRAWYDGVSYRTYAAIADPDTARELEESFGTYGVMATSEGNNTGTSDKGFETGSRSRGANTSYHEISRPLIRRDELLNDCRTDEAFIVMRGARIRCGRAISFRRKEKQQLAPSGFQPAPK